MADGSLVAMRAEDDALSQRSLVAGLEILREQGVLDEGEGVPLARLLRASAMRRGERPKAFLRLVPPSAGETTQK